MANRAYLIPRRLDLSGANLQVVDLQPNTSQRNSSLDGVGQSGYLKFSCDRPGLTTVNGANYVSGSRNTSPLAAITAQVDTNAAGGADSAHTAITQFGLLAYFQERVEANPGGAGTSILTSGECVNIVNDILARVYNGQSLLLADINTILVARAGANTALTAGNSFGTVEEVLRILSGETYRVRAQTLVGDGQAAPIFTPLATRTATVAAATGAFIGNLFAQGGFVARGTAGFREIKPLALTEAMRLSVKGGRLSRMVGANNLTFLNRSFAYTAGTVSAARPRALTVNGNNIPATGTDRVVVAYDFTGAVLS